MRSLLAVVVFLAFRGAASGQTSTGAVRGTAMDPSGAVLPGVTLRLENAATRVETKSVTNDTGFYSFPSVQPGDYSLKAELSGFKMVQIPRFTLNVNQVINQDITLTLGQLTETVEVRAVAPLLQAATAELGTVIEKKAVERIPLNGRNFTQLLLLTKGVNPVQIQQGRGNAGAGFAADSALRGSKFVRPSVNGQWNRSNVFLMDGVLNYMPWSSGYNILPSLDAVQEFKVQTQNDKGEFGGVLGGTVNLATSSGTSALHGSLFEFLRNQNFNARNPFTDIVADSRTGRSPGPGAFRQNQFGGTVGGPVYLPKVYDGRQKTFFFLSYDGWRFRQAASSLYRAPTPQEIGGDFSSWPQPIFDPTTTRTDPADPRFLIRTPFVNNRIPANRIDSMMRTYLEKYFDKPNVASLPFDNVVNNNSIINDANNWQLRLDHQLTTDTNIFARYNEFNNVTKNPINLLSRNLQDAPRKQAVLALNHMFTQRMLMQLRSAWNGMPRSIGSDTRPDTQTLVQEGWVNAAGFGDPNVVISQLGPSSLVTTLEEPTSVIQHSADLSVVRGSHEFKFGGLFTRTSSRSTELTHLINFSQDQTADPRRIGATGVALASALLGVPSSYSGEGGATGVRYSLFGFYVQDSWKATPRLTLNLSLRWDATVPPKYTAFGGGNIDTSNGTYQVLGKTLPPPCSVSAPPCIPGDGTLASIAPAGDRIHLAERPNLWVPDYNNFGPRLGLAWQFRPKTVLRAGGAVVFDVFSAVLQQYTDTQFRWPSGFICATPLNGIGESLTTVSQIVRECGAAQVTPHPWTLGSGHKIDRQRPESYQYHLEIQHQLGDNLTASIAYVGSLNRRMDYGPATNAALFPAPGTRAEVNERRPYPYIQRSVSYKSDDGRGYYSAFQMEINRRFSNGLMFLVSYTWSKSIDNGSSGFFGPSEAGPSGQMQNHYDRRVDRSVSSLNVPHLFSVSGTWELPAGKGKRRLRDGPGAWILGNWRLDFIQTLRNGQPWNARLNGDIANVGINGDYMRPHVAGDWKLANPTAELWVNPQAFAIPRFEYGNLGRNTMRSDAVYSTDLALAKDFPLSEGVRLELRAESFNLLNVMNYGVPNAFLQNRNFGRVTSLVELPRQFQFGLRLAF